ncbi:hypothetical protein BDW22DRAFT_1356009 [Trametopsis cervina]|nr:hypothetical protein BDW22DRAFT_1356009 [Trametopsis cervina]
MKFMLGFSLCALVHLAAAQSAIWQQCGGIGFPPTECAAGLECVELNYWFYQCLPPLSTTTSSKTVTTTIVTDFTSQTTHPVTTDV